MEIMRDGRKAAFSVLTLCISSISLISFGIVLPEESEEFKASLTQSSEGSRTASGEIYDGRKMSCSHPTLPFGTVLRVQNQITGRSIDAKVNQRSGKDGKIELSKSAANEIGISSIESIPVLATPIGMTTADLRPQESFQSNAIMVSFGSDDYDPSAFTPDEQKAREKEKHAQSYQHLSFQRNAVPVALVSNKGSEYPPLQVENVGSKPMSSTYTTSSMQTSMVSTPKAATQVSSQRLEFSDPVALPRHTSLMKRDQVSAQLPLRAQFGTFANSITASGVSQQLNSKGFETVVIKNGPVFCVVTRGTFPNARIATKWINDVRFHHRHESAMVRL